MTITKEQRERLIQATLGTMQPELRDALRALLAAFDAAQRLVADMEKELRYPTNVSNRELLYDRSRAIGTHAAIAATNAQAGGEA